MKPIRISFLVLPHTNLLDLGGASQVFYEAKDQGLSVDLSFCGSEDNLVTAMGLPLGKITSYRKEKLNTGDYLVILSPDYKYLFSKNFKADARLLNWLVAMRSNGVILCAICTGAFLLGKAGLLDGIKCTTHWKRTAQLQTQFPQAKVQKDILFIEDKGIYTSAGANSAVDVALHILSELKDDFFTHKIARELVIYNRRSGHESQQSVYQSYRNHVHNGIHKVQDYLQENLDKKNSLAELAEIANMSHRNFCRIFKKETTLTALGYITLLRREKIKELLKNPDISRAQIARHCGLISEKQISRIAR